MYWLKTIDYKIRNFLNTSFSKISSEYSTQSSQLLLKFTYRSMLYSKQILPKINEVGFKMFSQTDEDGILLYIFSIIGTFNKKCVEICAGNGLECNTANLIIHHGWHGLLIDGDQSAVKQGEEYYRNNQNTHIYPPVFINKWITRNNVNTVFTKNGFKGEIDLLSIDIDGVDYWIWESIKAINPRVVVIEYQDIIGPKLSLTVPYRDDFNAYEYSTTKGMPNFCGASLSALVKLGKKKGYRLVGCNRYGYNAFFIRKEIMTKEIPEIPTDTCFIHPKVKWGMNERFAKVKNLPWVKI